MILIRPSLFAFILSAVVSINSQASCNIPSTNFEKLRCNDFDVKAAETSLLVAERLQGCSADTPEYVSVAKSWDRQKLSCGFSPQQKKCLVDNIRAEVEYFSKLDNCNVKANPIRLTTADASYVAAHKELFIGVQTNVSGVLGPDSCDPESKSLRGAISDSDGNGLELPVIFSSLETNQRAFLCNKKPFSIWKGRVTITEHGGPVLAIDELLGSPLR